MKTVAKQLAAFFEEHDVAYEVIHHHPKYTAQQVAADTHTPGVEFAKTVLLHVNGDYAMAVLPAHHMVGCDRLGRELGMKRVRLATEDEIRELLRKLCPECELGATPPFGNIYGLPVYISKAMADDKHITFNAGTHEDAMRISYADYERLVEPRLVDFSKHIEPAQKRREEA